MKLSDGLALMAGTATLSIGGMAFAQCDLDQNQPNEPTYMAGFSQTGLAQSFQHQEDNAICGAGIKLRAGIGTSDNVRISLWDALPDEGGSMLAEANDQGVAGQWIDVFWDPVPITANTTYYLVFDGNTTLGIQGDTADPYPFGNVFANPGYNPFLTYDYTFRTYSGPARDCLEMSVNTLSAGQNGVWDISGAGAGTNGVIVWGLNLGETAVNGNFGFCADFGINGVNQNRVVGFWTADGNGQARVVRQVHYSLSGVTAHTQAAQQGTCPDTCMSAVDTQTIQ